MYMKKYYRFALMALLVGGLSLAVTSCKDDDKNNENGTNMEQAESTGGDMTLAETQLASLIANFGGLEAEEQLAQSGWKSKTYDASVGLVLDASRPTVRTIEVGNIEAADEQAALLLDALGFDTSNPSGFTFQDAEVGTVSYQHGGDANTLATINISVRQLPNITQLQMVRQYPTNPGDKPRYSLGDIIRKDGHLWICTNPAKAVGQNAYFVSFWTDHPKGTCSWGKEEDIVYAAKKPMANAYSLATWMVQFLMYDFNYKVIIDRLKKKGIDKNDEINQVIPATEDMRIEMIPSLKTFKDDREQLIEALSDLNGITAYTWVEKGDNGRLVAPYGRLLCDKMRWSMGLTYDYWVPQLYWVSSEDFNDMETKLKGLPSQNNNSYFKWQDYGEQQANSKHLIDNDVKSYHIIKVATHWQHKYFTMEDKPNQWAIFDFTADWSDNPDYKNYFQEDKQTWTRRNITSSEIVYTDNGEAMKRAEEIWLKSVDGVDEEPADEDPGAIGQNEPQVGKIIGRNGRFYNTVVEADRQGGGAVAMVAWLGGDMRAEENMDYNGLAIAINTVGYTIWSDPRIFNWSPCVWNLHSDRAYTDQETTGLESTRKLREGCGENHSHPAYNCHTYLTTIPIGRRGSRGISEWFIGDFYQYVLAMSGLGADFYKPKTPTSKTPAGFSQTWNAPNFVQRFTDAGANDLYENLTTQRLWTNTVKSHSDARLFVWTVDMQEKDMDKLAFENDINNGGCHVLFLLAFKYGEGGKEDILGDTTYKTNDM
jgi:hypothetical protein